MQTLIGPSKLQYAMPSNGKTARSLARQAIPCQLKVMSHDSLWASDKILIRGSGALFFKVIPPIQRLKTMLLIG